MMAMVIIEYPYVKSENQLWDCCICRGAGVRLAHYARTILKLHTSFLSIYLEKNYAKTVHRRKGEMMVLNTW